jgi:hypothetical protein
MPAELAGGGVCAVVEDFEELDVDLLDVLAAGVVLVLEAGAAAGVVAGAEAVLVVAAGVEVAGADSLVAAAPLLESALFLE